MDNQTELLDIVNKFDKVVGKDTKENKFKNELISRNVAIFIKDSQNKFLIVKRSPNKKSFPNKYDLAACGNVKSGETYEQAAERELAEELGITCKIKFLKKIYNEFSEKNKVLKYFTAVFAGESSQEVVLNDELVELKRLTLNEIDKLMEKDKTLFTPGFVNDYLQTREILDNWN